MALRVNAPTELPVFVDAGRVGQVLRNLLPNAVEYTSPGGEVAIIAVVCGPQVQVTVKDSGSGIPAEDLPATSSLHQLSSNHLARCSSQG